MAVSKKIAKIADIILDTARDCPSEIRHEVLDELINVWAEDEELSAAETHALVAAVVTSE